ncbi:MAG: acyltransferase [Desulfuromonas sp.]|nr:MAG: acyltransferase [Desulfuromonas sp.]
MRPLITALIQQRCTASPADNLNSSIAAVEQAAAQGADLIVLQELHGSLYFCQQEQSDAFELAEPIPGPTSDRLADLAKRLEIVLVASLFEKRAAGLYHNTAVVFDRDGSLAGRYRKMHIPDDPGYYEKFYFTPGDNPFLPIETSVGKLGVLICWDQWFPEAARLMALAGAELLIYPTAIGWDPSDDAAERHRQQQAWQLVQRGHAVANGLPVLTANRVGHEADPAGGPGIDFWGGSFIAGCQGELLAEASSDKTEIITASLDLAHSEQIRRIWPFFRDRRIDHYDDLLKRFRD